MQSEPLDPLHRAHLTGLSRPSPPIRRYVPSDDLFDIVQSYWVPVWSLSEPVVQSTLQYPSCLLVVADSYARFYGVTRGLATIRLSGDGWAVGVVLTPGAGALFRPVTDLVDSHVPLTTINRLDAEQLIAEIRAAMAEPLSAASHRIALDAYETRLRRVLPLDEEGIFVNEVVGWLRDHPEVTRVAEVAEAFGVSERALQRRVARRLGITTKWLIQRRRLHDAVARLKAGGVTLADIAAELGYADQAHFTHDFRSVTGVTPGAYLADQPRD